MVGILIFWYYVLLLIFIFVIAIIYVNILKIHSFSQKVIIITYVVLVILWNV